MNTFFISDIHLSEEHPKILDVFLNFLSACPHKADALYILGDLFELWIGDDYMTPFIQKIKNGLQEATQTGLPIYIMHGNRDFLMGKKFMKETGCRLLKDPTV